MRQIFKADSWGREDVSFDGMLPVKVCSSVLSLEKKKPDIVVLERDSWSSLTSLSGLIIASQGPVRNSVTKMRWTAPEELWLS